MNISIAIEGLEETISALKQVRDNVPDALVIGLSAGMLPIYSRTRTYPAQPAPRNPLIVYQRTNKYRDEIGTPDVHPVGGGAEGVMVSATPYSIYNRGDFDGYPGAYMHVGVWEPIQAIVDDELPHVVERVQDQVDQLAQQAGLT
jgi:hypothetical protein